LIARVDNFAACFKFPEPAAQPGKKEFNSMTIEGAEAAKI